VKHTMVTFQLHRTGVVLLVIGSLLVGGLLFAGGYLAGMRRSPAARVAMPVAPKAPPVNAALAGAATPAATPPPAPAAPAPPPEHYAIRAGLFTSNDEATAYLQQLTGRKLTATIASMPTTSGPTLYAVRIGDYPTRRAAATAAETLQREQGINGAIIVLQTEPIESARTTT
jgi:cell division septation protein DedD